jgi:hypothetical protein
MIMKLLLSLFSIVLLVSLYGCEGDTTNVNAAQPDNYFNERATLQGTIFDGVTGAKITDSSLKVTLVQGTSYRNASVRTGTQSFAGDYSLTNIPISINDQTEYRLVVSATGYQDFESTIAFDALSGSTLDKNYNFVGNVQLFQAGVGANDVTVNVFFNGEPVSGATVQLTRSTLSVIGTVSGTGAFLASNRTSGYLGNLSATTDANGVATFPSTGLVLGGTYGVSVLPVTYKGIPLAMASGASVAIGSSIIVQNVSMSDLVPGTSNGLYVVSASNTDPNLVVSSGVLTIVFSRAVSFVDETNILATLGGGVNLAALNTTSSPDSTTNATLSTDGLTLTLTPVFATAPTAFNGSNAASADDALVVTYSNVLVRLQDVADTQPIYSVFGLGGLVGPSGTTPSGSVLVTPNF